MRIAFLLLIACLVFGVGGVLGAGGLLLDKADEAGDALSAARELGKGDPSTCTTPKRIVSLRFSRERYPNIRMHARLAAKEGWPTIFVLNREGADERRDKALEGVPTKPGYDRDEVSPAVGRKTWRAHVALVPSSENRSAGARMGSLLRKYCSGTRFRYVFV